MTNLRIEDEHGARWVVEAGDPGRSAVNRLAALGYTYIVLPRGLLTNRSYSGTIGGTTVRDIRMADCLEALT